MLPSYRMDIAPMTSWRRVIQILLPMSHLVQAGRLIRCYRSIDVLCQLTIAKKGCAASLTIALFASAQYGGIWYPSAFLQHAAILPCRDWPRLQIYQQLSGL